ncbi:IPT/TIG domain-containing protein [Algoriphagus chordae]|uniref:IPT/TIG domain-containing protein n=1 Tax=Algoriphagus chordae TaxID=237019 RepID=A0A2W7RA70_9BACT|nr:IPT/TIG domain-containing protein [Algoriphagus chordae]PZX52557.1 IPT/TIG domain-containing protein [Algoriphagus chordae]
MRKFLSLGILAMLLLGWACTEDEEESVILVTEEVLYTSGEQVRLLGRLIANQPVKASDHGFYLSQDESFSMPIVISLGTKEGAGRFVGLIDELTIGSSYFVKAFMDIGKGLEFGNVIELSTLNPGLESFLPAFGSATETVTILGRNFTKDTRVFFNEVEAEVLNIEFESRLSVKIPPATSADPVFIKVLVQDKLLSFDSPFEYQTGAYQLISTFPEQVKLYDNVSFQNSAGFYIGLGNISKNEFYTGFQRYNPATSSWEKIDWPGTSRNYAFATSNYIGAGVAKLGRGPYTMNYGFWKVSASGFQQLADLTFDSRESLAFELNQNLYVVGSKEGDSLAVRKYAAATKQWTTLSPSPVAFGAANPHFEYQGKAYVVDDSAALWRYDPATDSWSSTGLTYPGSLGQGYGIAHVIGSKAYVGLYRRATDLWELDMNTMSWKSKNAIPGIPQSFTVGSFVQGESLYMMRVPDISLAGPYPMELYQFDPNGI